MGVSQVKASVAPEIDVYQSVFPGCQLFPIQKDTKKPRDIGYQSRTYRRAELEALVVMGGAAFGFVIPDDVCVVDVDPRNGGLESVNKLAQVFDLRDSMTLRVNTPSGNGDGFHLYFRKPVNLALRGSRSDFLGIDIKSKGYVLIAGSAHPDGGFYTFEGLLGFPGEPDPLPSELVEVFESKPLDGEAQVQGAEITAEQLKRILDSLDPCQFRIYDCWFNMLAAAHHATRGGRDALSEFVEWSTRDTAYADADDNIEKKWYTINERASQAGFGTLVYWLRHFDRDDLAFEIIREVRTGRLVLRATTNLSMLADSIENRIATEPGIFQKNNFLVQTTAEGKASPFKKSAFHLLTTNVAELYSIKEVSTRDGVKKKRMTKPVPKDVSTGLLERGCWPNVRELRDVYDRPIILADGSILGNGYHENEKYLVVNSEKFPKVPERPTDDQVEMSKQFLLDLVVDFPFTSDADKSGYFAGLLTVFGRTAFEGPTPFFVVSANQAGSGKGLLIKTIIAAESGDDPDCGAYPSNDEECEKRLVTLVKHSKRSYVFDNLRNGGSFGYPSLDMAITAGRISTRLLSTNDAIEGEFRTILFASGNNIQPARRGDITRRTVFIELETGENPENRTGFRHGGSGELLEYVKMRREKTTQAVLTILRAFFLRDESTDAAKCAAAIKPRGSFEGWSNVVRQCIVWLGLPDPDETLSRLKSSADDAIESLFEALEIAGATSEGDRMNASSILESLKVISGEDGGQVFVEDADADSRENGVAKAFLERVRHRSPGQKLCTRQAGYLLGDVAKKPINGRRINSKMKNGSNAYWVERDASN